jgi:hypothetical protein
MWLLLSVMLYVDVMSSVELVCFMYEVGVCVLLSGIYFLYCFKYQVICTMYVSFMCSLFLLILRIWYMCIILYVVFFQCV